VGPLRSPLRVISGNGIASTPPPTAEPLATFFVNPTPVPFPPPSVISDEGSAVKGPVPRPRRSGRSTAGRVPTSPPNSGAPSRRKRAYPWVIEPASGAAAKPRIRGRRRELEIDRGLRGATPEGTTTNDGDSPHAPNKGAPRGRHEPGAANGPPSGPRQPCQHAPQRRRTGPPHPRRQAIKSAARNSSTAPGSAPARASIAPRAMIPSPQPRPAEGWGFPDPPVPQDQPARHPYPTTSS